MVLPTQFYTLPQAIVVVGLAIAMPLTSYACDEDNHTDTTYSTQVHINEVLPNPSGNEYTDEFIELYNSGSTSVDLTGWELSDSTSKRYVLDTTLAAKEYLVIYREASGIALNNTRDTAELYAPNDVLMDTVEYDDTVLEDVSLALDADNTWQWTTELTPGALNRIAEDSENSEDAESDTDETGEEMNSELTPSYEYSTTIKLSELLPDPEGSDATEEWIELFNSGTKSVNLYGWQLADASRTYTIENSLELAGGEYLAFWVSDTKVSLNNSGERITLLDPANEVMDEVEYEDVETAYSYARLFSSSSTWEWTNQATPDEENKASSVELTTSSQVASVELPIDTTDVPEVVGTISIEAAKQQPKGEAVQVTGIVSVLPGSFGAQYFYMQDDTTGIQVYSSKKTFPGLTVGDEVIVNGKMSEVDGEPKINVTAAENITVISSENPLEAIALEGYNESQAGMLVSTSGEITSKDRSTIHLDSNWQLYIKRGTEIPSATFEEGEHVQIIGVLVANEEGVQVFPRSIGDVVKLTAGEDAVEKQSVANLLATPAHASNNDSSGTITELTTSNVAEYASQITTGGWLLITLAVIAGLVGLSRSEKLRTLVRNRIVQWAHALVIQSDHSVASGKNTMGLNVPNQYRE